MLNSEFIEAGLGLLLEGSCYLFSMQSTYLLMQPCSLVVVNGGTTLWLSGDSSQRVLHFKGDLPNLLETYICVTTGLLSNSSDASNSSVQ